MIDEKRNTAEPTKKMNGEKKSESILDNDRKDRRSS